MVTREARSDRPIVASMSDLAASGGYYIAMPAHAIVAQPSTLTGSIGVFGGKFVTGGLYAKLGAGVGATSSGRRAEMNSPIRQYTADEAALLKEQLQAFYDRFVEKAAESRGRTPADLERVAQGRIWTGRQALDHGLVDELGGLSRAIAVAKARADIPADSDVEIVIYPPPRSFYEILSDQISGAGADAGGRLIASLTSEERQALRVLRGPLDLFRRGEPLALLPVGFLH
jgi:protease-4